MENNKDFPNLLQALFILAVLLGVELLVSAAFIDFNGRFEQGDPVASGVILVFSFGIAFSCLMVYKNLTFANLFHAGNASAKAVLLLLAIPVVLLFTGLAVLVQDLLALMVVLLPMTQSQYDVFIRLMSGGVASLITLCMVAPFIEEMLFRGIFLRSFLHQYSMRQAILFSSLLFGIAHMNVYQTVVGIILGSLLGWVYTQARSLWPCILGHAAYNLSCFLLAVSPVAAPGGESADGSSFPAVSVRAAALLCVLLGGLLLRKLLAGRSSGNEDRPANNG